MAQVDWPMELNNYCQKNKITMSWNQTSIGPQNAATWTVLAIIGGTEYGRGSARNSKQAKAIAAEMALRALWQQRGQ
ncbi:hypothetical protein GY45DRAFT_1325876 [Cubamyces sp. BRFM 1775]|nr:hypothetical protein GY45DRAFT_1325876 [Cubamyces sp. BRFM 1775]